MTTPPVQPLPADVSRAVAQSGIAGAVASDRAAKAQADRLRAERKSTEKADTVELLASPDDDPDTAVEAADASGAVSPDLRDESVATPSRIDLRA